MGKWALVIRSLIQPDVHSPTSAVCQVPSWHWGWDEDQTLPLFAHSPLVPWEAQVEESPKGWPYVGAASRVSAGLAGEAGMCE